MFFTTPVFAAAEWRRSVTSSVNENSNIRDQGFFGTCCTYGMVTPK